ncbi:hypothetical protein Desaci_1715 [Desulfosporosinus acidiphilus SJ4]|uniref:Uncharacterized protein n=1 Tax=Desulfosporosinus acidiphilus (strain DSM 22704 / JCM 16185 / SJ4) TaxID=646529 RepID=I4D4I0_DESAJ|nr:hypothetical protein [Desulfosporosinus acidiphilus]AFM40704.1 hypothetical protein Desaci_1715 [Desulfosporosinus acidiphilus SJ4]
MYKLNSIQREEIVDSFCKVVDTGNSELISEDLYNHLNLNCNFPSHFSLAGFRDSYSGEHFQEFVDSFNHHSPQSQWLDAPEISCEFRDLNQTLADYASSHI